MTDQGQSEYYQAIARDFLRRRGAPFFLSPRDLAVIAAWEADRVPLDVVLEGVARAFDSRRDRSRGTKGLPLSFCDGQVRKAMAQHTDRGAGGKRIAAAPRSEKAARARKEVERCLSGIAEGEADLRPLLETASRLLAEEPPDEGGLERVDERVDEVLWRRAPRPGRGRAKRETAGGPAAAGGAEIETTARTRLVKDERRKHKIPYVSLFYY
jgi:hypothetical protein